MWGFSPESEEESSNQNPKFKELQQKTLCKYSKTSSECKFGTISCRDRISSAVLVSTLYFSLMWWYVTVLDGLRQSGSGSLRNSKRIKVTASCLFQPQETSRLRSLLILTTRLESVLFSDCSPCILLIIIRPNQMAKPTLDFSFIGSIRS